MHSDQFKPKSYLKLNKKYVFSEGEQFPLNGRKANHSTTTYIDIASVLFHAVTVTAQQHSSYPLHTSSTVALTLAEQESMGATHWGGHERAQRSLPGRPAARRSWRPRSDCGAIRICHAVAYRPQPTTARRNKCNDKVNDIKCQCGGTWYIGDETCNSQRCTMNT